jgi:hypothetical protein
MKTFKGTKGNWTNTGTHVFADKQTEDSMWNVCTLNLLREEYKANAKLIASAPELLKALQNLHTFSAQNNPTVGNYNYDKHNQVLIAAYKIINNAL